YVLYLQTILAHGSEASSPCALSQILSPCTRVFDCFQHLTSRSSRSYRPFPTIPWSAGHLPGTYVDCTEVVTAGSIGVIVCIRFRDTYCFRKGVLSPINEADNPTISITTVFFMLLNLYPENL